MGGSGTVGNGNIGGRNTVMVYYIVPFVGYSPNMYT